MVDDSYSVGPSISRSIRCRSVGPSISRSNGLSVGRSAVRRACRSVDRVAGRSVGRSIGLPVGRSIGWSVGLSAGRSVGRPAGRSDRLVSPSVVRFIGWWRVCRILTVDHKSVVAVQSIGRVTGFGVDRFCSYLRSCCTAREHASKLRRGDDAVVVVGGRARVVPVCACVCPCEYVFGTY